MKKIAIIAAITSAFTVAGAQAAGNGTINFTGTVNSQTCNATIGSTASGTAATVTLPAAQANVLATSGNTAGQTSFNISVTGCATTSPQGAGNVKALFEKNANVDSQGRLTNTATGGATNVALQLIDGVTNTPIIVGDASQSSNGYTNITSGSATLPYAVRYFATGTATAGSVTASVTYTLIYN
ncbi:MULTISPECIES: fimbrial protein [unclassified Cedecea]|uniref:fimbrial protein n=1 Tax=unclassified Cedecea TaxID=2649846 RepID=UPI003015EC89